MIKKETLPIQVSKQQGLWAGIVKIIKGNVCIDEILIADGSERDHYLTLDECLKKVGGAKKGEVVTVIMEEPLEGRIYRYGNNLDSYWEQVGTTCGYA